MADEHGCAGCHEFVESVARMTKYNLVDGCDSGEDAMETLNALIEVARGLVGGD